MPPYDNKEIRGITPALIRQFAAGFILATCSICTCIIGGVVWIKTSMYQHTADIAVLKQSDIELRIMLADCRKDLADLVKFKAHVEAWFDKPKNIEIETEDKKQ